MSPNCPALVQTKARVTSPATKCPRFTLSKSSLKWISCLSILLVVPSLAAQEMTAPIRQVSYLDAYKMLPGRLPKWENGYLVSWKMDTSASEASPNLALYDRDGKLVGKARVWLDGASFLRIIDTAVRRDGSIALVGYAVTSSGTLAGFLAHVSISQGSARIIQTSPFEGQAVDFGPDGTIWVLGMEFGPGRRYTAAPDHSMVQHFGADDTLQGQHLLRSNFTCELAAEGNMGLPRVAASSDRIGLFAPLCRMWVELTTTGELLGQWRWNIKAPTPSGVDGEGVRWIALSSTNELYGWRGSKEHTLVRFDRQASDWILVETPAARGAGASFTSLYSVDGDMLVYHTLENKLAWFQPSKPQNSPDAKQ